MRIFGNQGRLEGSDSDHDLACGDRSVLRGDREDAVGPTDRNHTLAEMDRQVERRRVGPEIFGDLVFYGVSIRIAGEWQTGQTAKPRRCEQPQGIPATGPRNAKFGRGVENHEVDTRLLERMPNGEAGLARTDHDDIDIGGKFAAAVGSACA